MSQKAFFPGAWLTKKVYIYNKYMVSGILNPRRPDKVGAEVEFTLGGWG